MIEQQKINIIITEGLKAATGCEVVKANLTGAPMPLYPYISFSIINMDTTKGTYAVDSSKRFVSLKQTWSFTVHGDKDDSTLHIAMIAKDWLEEAGRLQLSDHGIVSGSIGAITNRDTLLTVAYEYRKGFDAVFHAANVIEMLDKEVIEKAEIEIGQEE